MQPDSNFSPNDYLALSQRISDVRIEIYSKKEKEIETLGEFRGWKPGVEARLARLENQIDNLLNMLLRKSIAPISDGIPLEDTSRSHAAGLEHNRDDRER